MNFIYFLFILCSIPVIYSARILAIFPTPSYSHQLVARTLMLELHSVGHEIVILTTDPLGDKVPEKYTEINLREMYKYIHMDRWSNAQKFYRVYGLYTIYVGTRSMAEEIFTKEEIKKLIRDDNQHFDLIFYEWSSHASFTAFAEHFNCPIIGVRSLGLRVEVHGAVGNPVTPSYLPVAFMDYSDDFFGRLTNAMVVVAAKFMYQYLELPYAEDLAKQNFPNHKTHVADLEKNVSLSFIYTNPILLGVRPFVPSVVEFGGLHVKRRVETVPEDIETYLNNSKQGVIYFSLGTLVSSQHLSQNIINMLAETFTELPYNIILKMDHNPFKKKIKNVICCKWVSQEAILGHPNTRLFISHTGLLSVWEAISYRIPILGIPIHTDQFYNTHRIVELGMGLRLDFLRLTKLNLLYAINEVITNSSYKHQVEKIAKIIDDQPISSREKVLWWTEYVLRNRGAPYFKSKAVDMHWFIYYSLDVVCFIVFILMITSYTIYLILKFIHSIICIMQKKTKIQ